MLMKTIEIRMLMKTIEFRMLIGDTGTIKTTEIINITNIETQIEMVLQVVIEITVQKQ